jgi:DMSO/TMAO reductase YedYZ heme-binding membrane subunit
MYNKTLIKHEAEAGQNHPTNQPVHLTGIVALIFLIVRCIQELHVKQAVTIMRKPALQP